MDNLLYRLYKTRLMLAAAICSGVGLGLMILQAWIKTTPNLVNFVWLPIGEVGSLLFAGGIFGMLIDAVNKQITEELTGEQLRKVVREEAPALADAVMEGMASSSEALKRVASPAMLDRITENSLALRLGDATLAHEIHSDWLKQIVGARNFCYDAKLSISLAPWAGRPASDPDAMFVATIRWEYKVEPLTPTMRFSSVSTEADYRDMLRDPTMTSTWIFRPAADLDGSSPEAFQLLQFTVDGQEQKIRRSSRKGAQTYAVQIEESRDRSERPVISYTLRALVRRHGHLLNIDIARPMRGLTVELAYAGCGIQSMKTLDYIAGANQPRITRTPEAQLISLSFDGWVWPKGGVGFVWTLEHGPLVDQ